MEKSIRYNSGKPKWSLVHFESLEPLVRVLEFGAEKYSRDNWKIDLDLKEIIDSAMRHLTEMSDDNLYDKETNLLHAGHVLCNMMFWIYHYNKQQNQTEAKNELG